MRRWRLVSVDGIPFALTYEGETVYDAADALARELDFVDYADMRSSVEECDRVDFARCTEVRS